ncbi:MAG: hypothetical protein H7070_01070 [Saprospiraceae bacterium]|nr:hypothetical protein [Pyrinomonadaceae bacterium]
MADDQLNYRIDEIFRIATALLEKSKTHDGHFEAISTKIGKTDKRFDSMDSRFDSMDNRFDRLENKVEIIYGQLTDMASKLIELDIRLAAIEAKINLVEVKITGLDTEIKQIRIELDELNQRFESEIDSQKRIDELSVRVFQIEEKLTA